MELFGFVFGIGLMLEEVVVWSIFIVGQMMKMVVLFELVFVAGVVFGLKVKEMVKCVWSEFMFEA